MFTFRGADILSRIEERTNLVRADAINKVIPEYYVFLDKLVGELIMNYNPGSITAVIMDPGKIGRANRKKGHLVLSGVDIVPNSVTDYEIKLEDIAPTLLYFTGVPGIEGHGRQSDYRCRRTGVREEHHRCVTL